MRSRCAVKRPYEPLGYGVRAARAKTAASARLAPVADAERELVRKERCQKRQQFARLEYGAQSGLGACPSFPPLVAQGVIEL